MFASPFYVYRLSLFTAVVLLAAGLLALLVGFAAQVSIAAGSSAPQTTFVVTTNADTNDGSCDAHCTLREAIIAANTLTGTDVIVFSLLPTSQTITLTAPLPDLRDNMTIDGSTATSLTISGNDQYQIVGIYPSASVTLTHMSIVSGFSNFSGMPAGIGNYGGSLTIDHVSLRGNRSTSLYTFGGGIGSSYGSLFVHNSTFINNFASAGAGIANQYGSLIIRDSYFRGNEVVDSGAGIISGPVTEVSHTIFIDNNAARYGGGIIGWGILTLTNSTFSHNSAASFSGGAMVNNGTTVINQTTFFSNTAVLHGGAILNFGSLTVRDSVFGGNTAGQYGGAIANSNDFFPGTILVTHSLFQQNVAGFGGGIANWDGGQVEVLNSTFSANQAITAGGGISNSQSLWLNNVTLSDNEAAVAGGLVSSGIITMSNSIVANSVGGDCANSGLFNTNVYNLVEDGSCNPLLSGDPLLGPLADNGGATWTHALLPGSPALDAGDEATCELTDQRGVMRPLDGDGDGTAVCDIGAVEQEFTPIPTPTPTPTPPPPSFRVFLPLIWKEG